MPANEDLQKRLGRVEELVRQLDSAGDPALRRVARDLIATLMELNGAGFERVLEVVKLAGEPVTDLVEKLTGDDLISSLLVLYGLHPDDFETRVRRGLDKVRPHLRSQGIRVELIGISEGSVHLKMVGAESGDYESEVRESLFATAPDIVNFVIEGGAKRGNGFVPLSSLKSPNGSPLDAAAVAGKS